MSLTVLRASLTTLERRVRSSQPLLIDDMTSSSGAGIGDRYVA